ncbi:unnamed protein product [Caenorhabditis brenneri]
MFRSGAFLFVLFGAGLCTSFSHTRDISVTDKYRTRWSIPTPDLNKLYGSGDHPSVCLNLSISNPVRILVGGCTNYIDLGIFGSGVVQLNRTTIDESMQFRTLESCESKFEVLFESNGISAQGKANLFKCDCFTIIHPTYEPKEFYPVENVTCQIATSTWEDRKMKIRFNLRRDVIDRRTLHLEQAIQAATVEADRTICMKMHGDGFVNLTFGNCDPSKKLTILLMADTLYGLPSKEMQTLAEMAAQECRGSNKKLHVDMVSPTAESRFGTLSLFGCKREKAVDPSEPFHTFEPKTAFMGKESEFFFNMKSDSLKVFSADLAYMIDLANNEYGRSKVQVAIDSFAPVGVALSRCRAPDAPDHNVMIIANASSGVFELNTEVAKYLLLLPKCDIFDDDEALYLGIRTWEKLGASGTVKFSFVAGPGSESHKAHYPFELAPGSTTTRVVDLAPFAEETLMNRSTIGYQLYTNDTIEFLVSRCPTSPRQLLGSPHRNGIFTWTRSVVEGIIGVMAEKCDASEEMQENVGYLHITSTHGAVNGSLTIARMKSEIPGRRKIVEYVPFTQLNAKFIASPGNDMITLHENDLLPSSPVQVDLKYFTRAVLENPNMDIFLQTATPEPITLTFSRGKNDTENQLTVDVSELKVLNLDQVKELNRIMKSAACKDNAKYGMFVSVQGRYRGSISISIRNFRVEMETVEGNYSTNDEGQHYVPVLLEHMNRTISIRVTNSEDKPVLIAVSMCSKLHTPMVLWHEKFTLAHFKFDSHRLNRLSEFSGDCKPTDPAADKMAFFITIQSEKARGKIIIDKIEDIGCDGFPCSEGVGLFYDAHYLEGVIIAQ